MLEGAGNWYSDLGVRLTSFSIYDGLRSSGLGKKKDSFFSFNSAMEKLKDTCWCKCSNKLFSCIFSAPSSQGHRAEQTCWTDIPTMLTANSFGRVTYGSVLLSKEWEGVLNTLSSGVWCGAEVEGQCHAWACLILVLFSFDCYSKRMKLILVPLLPYSY